MEIQEHYRQQALSRRPEGFGLSDEVLGKVAIPSAADIETKTVQVQGKPVTFARRRPDTVWTRLATQLGPDLVDAGERLTEIYAEMMGLAGAPERDPGMPVGGRRDPTEKPTRMLEAGREWAHIMAGFGLGSSYPAMFSGLCQDIMEAEFSPLRGPGLPVRSRWRVIVEATCREPERHAQATCVRLGCQQLMVIMSGR